MAIHRIEDVKINGKNQAFGGFIYAVDYDVGLLDKPTTVTVTFISESGTYLEPELSVTKPYRIQIGNIINENFYAITRTIKKSSSGRTLEVTFKDGSIILDRIWVGLYKRMGDATTNIPGLIIMGREIHPCDVNEDGVFDQKDADLLAWRSLDPCELKCPADANETEPVVENCIRKEITELFDVKYSFDDLLDALTGAAARITALGSQRNLNYPVEADLAAATVRVSATLPAMQFNRNTNKLNQIKIKLRPRVTNASYLAAYTGTLREVLRNWCADFGWSFFWEEDSLNFIDTKERPKINLQTFANLESVTDTKTLEGTVSQGFISHYAQGGIESQQNCSQSRPLILRCLNLRDLYGQLYKPAWNAAVYNQGDYTSTSSAGVLDPPQPDPSDASPDNQVEYRDDIFSNGVPIENFEASCVCAYYSDTLRHLYNLWEYYGIKDPESADVLKGKWLDRLGQMKIINVFSNSSQGDNLQTFRRLTATDVKDRNLKTVFSPDEIERIRKYNGYIVVGLRNRLGQREDMLDKQFRLEENLATNFIGQHWYRAYVAPFYGETPQVFPNGQYFGALSTNVRDLPFASFNHTHRSNVAKMVSSFVQRQRNDYRQYGNLRFSQNYSKNISKKLVRSIIYFNRNVSESWQPLKNPETQLSALLKELDNYMFRSRTLEDFSTEDIRPLVYQDGNSLLEPEFYPFLELFVFFPTPKTGFRVQTKISDNPNIEHPQYTESLEPFALSTAGLLGNRCAQYLINGTPIYTPASASVLLGGNNDKFKWDFRQPTKRDFDIPGYKVFVTSSSNNRGLIQKTESVAIQPADPTNVLKVDYQVKDVTRDALQILNKLTSECNLSPDEIRAIHEKYATNLNFNITNPFTSRTYRVMGVTVPRKIAVRDGLESLKVRIDENGVFTDIGVGDTLFTPPSPNLILRTLEFGTQTELANLKTTKL